MISNIFMVSEISLYDNHYVILESLLQMVSIQSWIWEKGKSSTLLRFFFQVLYCVFFSSTLLCFFSSTLLCFFFKYFIRWIKEKKKLEFLYSSVQRLPFKTFIPFDGDGERGEEGMWEKGGERGGPLFSSSEQNK